MTICSCLHVVSNNLLPVNMSLKIEVMCLFELAIYLHTSARIARWSYSLHQHWETDVQFLFSTQHIPFSGILIFWCTVPLINRLFSKPNVCQVPVSPFCRFVTNEIWLYIYHINSFRKLFKTLSCVFNDGKRLKFDFESRRKTARLLMLTIANCPTG